MAILKEADAVRPVNEMRSKRGIRSATDQNWKARYGRRDTVDLKRVNGQEAARG